MGVTLISLQQVTRIEGEIEVGRLTLGHHPIAPAGPGGAITMEERR
jgi:hypothetical protein